MQLTGSVDLVIYSLRVSAHYRSHETLIYCLYTNIHQGSFTHFFSE